MVLSGDGQDITASPQKISAVVQGGIENQEDFRSPGQHW